MDGNLARPTANPEPGRERRGCSASPARSPPFPHRPLPAIPHLCPGSRLRVVGHIPAPANNAQWRRLPAAPLLPAPPATHHAASGSGRTPPRPSGPTPPARDGGHRERGGHREGSAAAVPFSSNAIRRGVQPSRPARSNAAWFSSVPGGGRRCGGRTERSESGAPRAPPGSGRGRPVPPAAPTSGRPRSPRSARAAASPPRPPSRAAALRLPHWRRHRKYVT